MERSLHAHQPGPGGCQVPLADVGAGVRGAGATLSQGPPPRRHPPPPWRRRHDSLVSPRSGDGTRGAMGVA